MSEEEEFEFRLRAERERGMTHTESVRAKAVKPSGAFTDFFGGIKEGFQDIDRGIGQRQEDIKSWIGKGDPVNRQRLYDLEKKTTEDRMYGGQDTEMGQLGRGVARVVPAAGAMAVPGGQSLPASTAISGAMGGLEGWMRPSTSPGDAGANAAVGAFGAMAGNAASRSLLPTTARNMDAPEKELLDIADRHGIRLRTSEATGSAAIKNLEAVAANRPFTAGAEKTFAKEQTKDINKAITMYLGKPIDNLDDKALLNFGKDLGSDVGKYLNGKTVDLLDVLPAFENLSARASEGGALTMSAQTKKLLDDTLSTIKSQRKMDGATALRVKSDLQRRMRDAFNNENTELAENLREIVRGFDDAMAATMSPAEKVGWEQARRRYSNYKIIEDAMYKNPKSVADADIPIKKLARTMEQNMPGSYAKGTGDFAPLAKLGQKIDAPQRNALVGQNPIPFVGFGQDVLRATINPVVQSKAAQTYLTGALPGIKQIRDNKAATRALDTALRTAGLLSIEDWLEE
jgi:hypothetical protein